MTEQKRSNLTAALIGAATVAIINIFAFAYSYGSLNQSVLEERNQIARVEQSLNEAKTQLVQVQTKLASVETKVDQHIQQSK